MGNNKDPNQKRPGEKEPGTLHYNPGNMSGKTEEKRQDMSRRENRKETKANRLTNGVPQARPRLLRPLATASPFCSHATMRLEGARTEHP